MNDVTTTSSTSTTDAATTAPAAPARSAALDEALAAYGPDSLTATAPTTNGQGVEVEDVVEMLAELKFLKELGRLF